MMERSSWWLAAALIGALTTSAAAQFTPIGDNFRVNTYTLGDQSWGSNDRIGHGVAVAPNGDVFVTWNSAQDPDYGAAIDIFAQRYSGGGALAGSEFQVNTYTNIFAPSHHGPAVVADGQGNFIVVYSGFGPGTTAQSVGGQRYDSDGAPLGTEFYIAAEHGSAYAPVVAADADGDFVVVWNESGQFGVGTGIYAQQFDATGAKQGTQIPVTSAFAHAAVTADPDGNFVVAWPQNGVFARRFASDGGALGTEFQVNTYTTAPSATYANIASAPNGDFIVAWQNTAGQDGEVSGIFAQRYSSGGERAGTEFQVNEGTTGYQTFPDLATDAEGNFIIAGRHSPSPGTWGPCSPWRAATLPTVNRRDRSSRSWRLRFGTRSLRRRTETWPSCTSATPLDSKTSTARSSPRLRRRPARHRPSRTHRSHPPSRIRPLLPRPPRSRAPRRTHRRRRPHRP
jgi:hypothetical protein